MINTVKIKNLFNLNYYIITLISLVLGQPEYNCCEYQNIAENECVGLGCYIPQCTETCDWEIIQCWTSTGYCWCVDINGNEIDGTSQPSWQGLPECSENCNYPFIEIDGFCFHADDITVLQEMINNSIESGVENSPNSIMDNNNNIIIDGEYIDSFSFNNNENIEPLELGMQEWENGRITSFMCGAYIYCNLSGEIPYSISNLTEINVLRLELNYFSGYIPENICDLNHLNLNSYINFDLSYNQLCPPYPECIPENALSNMYNSYCYSLGDINNDSYVNILDILITIGFILMIDEPTNYEFFAGDINSDQLINILDVMELVQIILNPNNYSCYTEPQVGDCDGICPTFYFNQINNECEEFITGCCGVEVFNTIEECQNECE